tara:strand:- start:1611 stop:2171 length:561 start_codon:yes stop_codon:yes gene_type:complete
MDFPHMNYNKFFSMVDDIGHELNERKNRFDKSDIFEQAAETFSGGKLKWVDAEGWDHEISGTDKLTEQKTQQYCLYTKTGKLKSKTGNLRLTNTLGDVNSSEYKPKYDYLQIIDTGNPKSYSVAIVSVNTVKKYVVKTSDCWIVQIPTSELKFLCKPSDVAIHAPTKRVSYLKEKREAQMRLISQF